MIGFAGADRLKSRNNVSLRRESSGPKDSPKEGPKDGPYAQIAAHTFTFRELAVATRNFSPDCFLGEGGFGHVYRGRLQGSSQVFFYFFVICMFFMVICNLNYMKEINVILLKS